MRQPNTAVHTKPEGTVIFLSHATEDKDAIARPLKEALATRYPVWWDEDVLTAGDSLFVSINKGLATCEFGVIVLSPAYLQKKWTTAELAGLFSLETTTRKVLIPVHHNVTTADVQKVFPVLADRWAPSTSKGVAYVVDCIFSAVEVARKQRELTAQPSVIDKILSADAVERKKAASAALSSSPAGVKNLVAQFDVLITRIAAIADEITAKSSQIKFRWQRKPDPYRGGEYLELHTSPLLTLAVALRELYSNDASSALLKLTTIQRAPMMLETRAAPSVLDDLELKPTFDEDGTIVWSLGKSSFSTEGLAEYCVHLLYEARQQVTS